MPGLRYAQQRFTYEIKKPARGRRLQHIRPMRKDGSIFHVRWILDRIQSYISYAAQRHISYLSNLRLDKYFIAIAVMISPPPKRSAGGKQAKSCNRKKAP